MTQTVPLSIELGAGNTGRAIGYRVLNLDRTTYATFKTAGVGESAVAGTYYVSGGIIAPDAGAYVVAGTLATDYAEYAISPAPLLPDVAGRKLAVDAYGRAAATLAMTARAVQDALVTQRLTLFVGVTLVETVRNLAIPSNWAAAAFTLKASEGYADSQALAQIVAWHPESQDVDDGLLILNGEPAEDPDLGSLTVDQGAGTIQITLHQEATGALEPGRAVWDLKVLTSDSPAMGYLLADVCKAVIQYPVTRAMSLGIETD